MVPQVPSLLMQDALLPVMRALIAQEMQGHHHVDVKVSVASCFSELTRITAPVAPYKDELMKEIFELTVAAFEKLSCASGCGYTKAISILDTMANVRSCLMILDLECNKLIVKMFQLFSIPSGFKLLISIIFPTRHGMRMAIFKASNSKLIRRSSHPHSVLLGMETTMTLVIQESDEISFELLIPRLTSMRKENQNMLPLPWRLGENVFKNCAAKLRTYLPEAVQFMGLNLNDFAEIVPSICQNASKRKPSSSNQDRVSNKQVGNVIALDDDCPERATSLVDGSSRSIMNGPSQMRSPETLGDENFLKTLVFSE